MTQQYTYVAFRFFSNAAFFVPILVLHIERQANSPSLAFALVGIYGVTVFATEIPTGLVADSLGLKNTLIAGTILSAVAAFLLGTSTSFGTLAFGQIASATAISLQSGADSAYLLALFPKNKLFESLEGISTSVKYVGLFLSSVLGSVLYVLDPHLPFVLSALAALSGVACLVKLPSVNPIKEKHGGSLGLTLRQTISQLKTNRSLLLLLVFAAFSLASLSSIYWSYQFYLESIGISVELFGTVFAIAFLASSVGAGIANKVNEAFGYKSVIAVLGILIGMVAVLMSAIRSSPGVVLPVITQAITGYLSPTLRILILQKSQSSTPATLLSIESMLHRVFMSVNVFSMGFLIHTHSLSVMMLGAGVALLFILPAFALVALKE